MLRSEIVGSIKMRVFLSGMPELRLGLNDKVLFDNTGREYPCQLPACGDPTCVTPGALGLGCVQATHRLACATLGRAG